MSVKLTPGTILASIAAALAIGIAVSFLPVPWWGSLIAGAVAFLVGVVAVRGDTFVGTVKRRFTMKPKIRPCEIVTMNGVGMTWDRQEERLSLWIELSPEGAFAITRVSEDGDVSRRPVDTKLVSDLLVQDDIRLESARFVTIGMRSAHRTRAAAVVSQIIGESPVPVGGRTFLVLSTTLATCHSAALSRAVRGDVFGGLLQAMVTAGTRTCMRLRHTGITATMLSPFALGDVTQSLLPFVGEAADQVGWQKLGGQGDVNAVVTCSPTSPVTPELRAAWLDMPGVVRVVEMVELRSTPSGLKETALVSLITAQDDDDVHSLSADLSLRRVRGKQLHAISRAIPHIADLPLPEHLETAPQASEPFPGSLELFVGRSPELGRVFMHMGTRADQPLHIVGSQLLVQQIIERLSVIGSTVDVRLPDPTGIWQRTVDSLASPLVTMNTNPHATIVVVPPSDEARNRGKVIVAVDMNKDANAGGRKYLIATVSGGLAVRSNGEQIIVPWTMPESERRLLPAN